MALNRLALEWHARSRLARLGALGVIGLGLVVFAVAFQLSAVSALEAELGALHAEGERLHRRHQVALKQPAGTRLGPAQQLETFYDFFPVIATLPEWLLRIVAAADRQGVVLEMGDYKLVQEKGSRLARYQMTLPVKGSYEQIRGFVGAVLNDVPAAAVEDIALKRDAIGARVLDAQLKLTLYLRPEK